MILNIYRERKRRFFIFYFFFFNSCIWEMGSFISWCRLTAISFWVEISHLIQFWQYMGLSHFEGLDTSKTANIIKWYCSLLETPTKKFRTTLNWYVCTRAFYHHLRRIHNDWKVWIFHKSKKKLLRRKLPIIFHYYRGKITFLESNIVPKE